MRRLAHWTAPLALVLLATACEDELANPRVQTCDETLDIVVETPGILRYLVSGAGNAVVQSITYSTPAGDSTLAFPLADSPNGDLFRKDVRFEDPAEATFNVMGEVAAGGEIGITYSLIPTDGDIAVENGPLLLCGLTTG